MGIFRQFPYSNFHEMNMDEIIKIVKNMLEEWAQYYTTWDNWKEQVSREWAEMQVFINNYFDNLDVQNEINNKIRDMVSSGEFSSIVDPYVPPVVSEWLSQHITVPESVVIDDTLSIRGAVADAKATGDAITDVKSDLDKVFEEIGTSTDIPLYRTSDGWKLTGNGLCTSDSTATLKKYKVKAGDILYLKIEKETPNTFQFQKDIDTPASGTNPNLIGNAYANGIDGYIIVPPAATYLITSQLTSNTTNKVQKYVIDIDESVSALQTIIGVLNGRFDTIVGKNLFNKDDDSNLYGTSSSNCYVMDSNGVPYNSTESDAAYCVSCFVPVEEGKTVYFSFRDGQTYAYQLALFDSLMQFVSMTTWVDHYTIPSGVSYIRVTAVKLPDQFQIEYGARTSYVPYSATTYLNGVKVYSDDVVSANRDYLVLPSKMYGVQNKEYDIFLKNVIVGNYNKFIVGKSGTGEQLSRRIRYIISPAGATNTSITLYDDIYNEIQTKNISYVNANANAHSGETLKVLVIGDSFINSGYVTGGLIRDFDEDVATLQLLGTLGTTPNLHEGRNGWSSYEYTHESSVGSVSNPFINNGVFDFGHYISANNISTPDYVIINLGINDGWKDMHGTTTAENLQTMINSIHAYNSSIKVIIGTTPSPYLGDAENGYLLELLTNRKRQMLTRNVLENITESATVIICPTHLNFDTDYNFNMSTITKNGQNSETIPYCSDDTHPAHTGFYQIADSYYACIKAN